MGAQQYLIDDVCRISGFTRRTVHYYVQEGLVDPPAGRGRGGFYSEVQLRQLARIRELQEQGYRLDAIRGLVAPARTAAAAPRPPAPAPLEGSGTWTRIDVVPGVELHVSAEARSRLGPALADALRVLRAAMQNEGGSDE